MRNGVQILSGVKSANPKTLLPDTFKAGIVTLDFCPQSIDFLRACLERVHIKMESKIIAKEITAIKTVSSLSYRVKTLRKRFRRRKYLSISFLRL